MSVLNCASGWKSSLNAWELKGGDPKPYRDYVDAIAVGPKIDVTDVSTSMTVIRTWLKSPSGGVHWLLATCKFVVVLLISLDPEPRVGAC